MSGIAGFVTRADADLVPPESVSHNIAPHRGGSCVHHGGPDQKIFTHRDCIRRWNRWQHYHMQTLGWVDIAYNGGVCQHGYAFAGRGLGVRSAANGTSDANWRYYAWAWIGGGDTQPTDKAVAAFAWWVAEARKAGGAGGGVEPHSAFRSTSCPGNVRPRIPDIVSQATARRYAMIVFAPSDPDADAVGWAETHIQPVPGVVTRSRDEAAAGVSRGERVVAVGTDLQGAESVKGGNRAETSKLVVDLAARSWA